MTARFSKCIVMIGASTGGVRTLERLLTGLPLLPASIVLIQHIPSYINDSLQQVFSRSTAMEVKVAQDGEALRDGCIYIAPGDVHLRLIANRRIQLFDGEKVHFVRPAIDVAMKSLEKRRGDYIIGVVLTGMGVDGAEGLAHIKAIVGLTIAQDEASCVVYGMPKAAFETGCVDLVLSPEASRDKLIQLLLPVETSPS